MSRAEMFQTTRIPGPAGQAVRMTVRVQRAICSKCGATEDIPNTGKSSTLPPVVISERLRRLGWSIGQTRSKDVCPKCVAKTKTGPAELPFNDNATPTLAKTLAEFAQDITPPVADQRENETMSETPVTGRKANTLNYLQRKDLETALLAVCSKVIINDIHVGSRYAPGHTDQTVADAMPFDCSGYNVAGLRKLLLGNFYTEPKPAKVKAKADAETIATLSARLDALETDVIKLLGMVERLDPQAYAKAV